MTMTPSPQSAEAQERDTKWRKKPVVIEAFCLDGGSMPDWFLEARSADVVQTFSEGTGNPFNDPLKFALIHTMEGVMRAERGDWIIQGIAGEIYPCKPDIFAATYERASLPSAAASGEASAVQEAEAPNFCARCGKRLGAGIHTCTPPSAQEAEPKLPTYGTLPWATVRAYVTAAAGAPPIIDADYDIGHQVVGINFNSLNRIMSALAASPVPMASSAGEPVAYLLTSKSGMTKWTLTASEVDYDVREAFLADGVGIQPLGHLAPPTASLREQEWESLYRRMKNCAGGYSNLCEEDRPAARQLEKEYAQIDQEARNLIDAQRLGRGKENGNG